MSDLYTRFDNIFFEKTRLSILTILYRDEKVAFNTFLETVGGTDGGIYSHLEKLLKSGYIDKNKELAGNSVQTVYFLTSTGRKAFREYIEFIEGMLEQHGERKQ